MYKSIYITVKYRREKQKDVWISMCRRIIIIKTNKNRKNRWFFTHAHTDCKKRDIVNVICWLFTYEFYNYIATFYIRIIFFFRFFNLLSNTYYLTTSRVHVFFSQSFFHIDYILDECVEEKKLKNHIIIINVCLTIFVIFLFRFFVRFA